MSEWINNPNKWSDTVENFLSWKFTILTLVKWLIIFVELKILNLTALLYHFIYMWLNPWVRGSQTTESLGPIFINKISLEHSHTCLFMYCLSLLSHNNDSWVLKLRPYDPKNLKHQQFGPLEKKFVDLCF